MICCCLLDPRLCARGAAAVASFVCDMHDKAGIADELSLDRIQFHRDGRDKMAARRWTPLGHCQAGVGWPHTIVLHACMSSMTTSRRTIDRDATYYIYVWFGDMETNHWCRLSNHLGLGPLDLLQFMMCCLTSAQQHASDIGVTAVAQLRMTNPIACIYPSVSLPCVGHYNLRRDGSHASVVWMQEFYMPVHTQLHIRNGCAQHQVLSAPGRTLHLALITSRAA